MNNRSATLILFSSLACLLITCSTPEINHSATAPVLQKEYSPPQFEDPDRLAKISAALQGASLNYQEARVWQRSILPFHPKRNPGCSGYH